MHALCRYTIITSLLRTAVLSLLAVAMAQSIYAQDDLAKLEAMWKRGDYRRVLPELIDYREKKKARTVQIDYMIATSACRMSDRRQTGFEFFGWILQNYNLNSQNRGVVEAERQKCSTGARPEPLRAIVPTTLVGIVYHGKTGLELQASSSGNARSDVVESIPEKVFSQRLFSAKESKTAARRIGELLGPGHEVESVGHFILAGPKPARMHVYSDPAASRRAERTGTTQGTRLNQPASPNRAAFPNEPAIPNQGVAPPGPVPPNSPGVSPSPVSGSSQTEGSAVPPKNIQPATVNAANVNPANVPSRGTGPESVQQQGVNASGVTGEVGSPERSVRQHQIEQRRAGQTVAQQPLSDPTGESDLKKVGESLENYLRFFMTEYQMSKPSHLITVYFAQDTSELQQLARKLHGIQLPAGSLGYSFPSDQSLVGWADGKAYGTFAHELFHVMVHNEFGDIPPWLDEGLAALYEVSKFEGSRAVGIPNWRGRILNDLWAARPHLRVLVQMNRTSFDDADENPVPKSPKLVAGERQAVNHATARYFILYLQEKGHLLPVYNAFLNRKVNDHPADEAVDLLQSVLRLSLDDIDADFAKWFKTIPH